MTLGEPLSEEEMKEMLKDLPVDEDGYDVSMNCEIGSLVFACSFIEYENFCSQFQGKDDSLITRTTNEEKN